MEKSIYSPQYEIFRAQLVELRRAAGLTQRQLATKLKLHYSLVARMETGQRRVDIVELYWVAKACGVSLKSVADDLDRQFKAMDKSPRRTR